MCHSARFFTQILFVCVLICTAHVYAVSPAIQELEKQFVEVGQRLLPSVVNIDTKEHTLTDAGDLNPLLPFFGLPLPQEGEQQPRRPMPERATGSGFIYDTQGHIVTNNHVVEKAEKITVRLHSGKEYPAKVIGTDTDTDLAVLKIDAPAEELVPATLGDSDLLKPGQFAIAVGSPRGFVGSLSFGHISALGRTGLPALASRGLRFQDLIQTDTAINLGNSGGPLCNIAGEVIGINIAIVWDANSIGFAIPVNTAKRVVPQLIAEGRIVRGYLGVAIENVTDYQDALGLEDGLGAFVKGVQVGTPAERAQLQVYDVIRKVNEKPVQNASDLVAQISAYPPGTTVNLEVWRKGGIVNIAATLDEWKGKTVAAEVQQPKSIFGLMLSPITPQLQKKYQVAEDVEGVVVTGIEANSPAEETDLREGDVIIEVAQTAVKTVADIERILTEQGEKRKAFLFRYVRGGNPADITVLRVNE